MSYRLPNWGNGAVQKVLKDCIQRNTASGSNDFSIVIADDRVFIGQRSISCIRERNGKMA
ncbi:unnamed protein product [Nezara viridula]|uniref:Uncharacterized protein n=1 Tax=Nezara viridula TaxID=85310 RepID=A0A9P0HD11_NEZVI|nr:unnamed protein product [Nezara viridula]